MREMGTKLWCVHRTRGSHRNVRIVGWAEAGSVATNMIRKVT
jgi:hypothetical protein